MLHERLVRYNLTSEAVSLVLRRATVKLMFSKHEAVCLKFKEERISYFIGKNYFYIKIRKLVYHRITLFHFQTFKSENYKYSKILRICTASLSSHKHLSYFSMRHRLRLSKRVTSSPHFKTGLGTSKLGKRMCFCRT